jgi:hypothetical protein
MKNKSFDIKYNINQKLFIPFGLIIKSLKYNTIKERQIVFPWLVHYTIMDI